MRRTDRELLAELEAESAFQRQTLRTICVVAEAAPPERAPAALRAISALATEALVPGERQDPNHSSRP